MKAYNKPEFYVTEFQSNAYVAGCDLNIVSGTDTVKVYCSKTSYTTIFTSSISCAYNINPFTSNGAAESFFSKLFQWGDGIAERGSVTNNTTSLGWTDTQKQAAEREINNGKSLYYEDTYDLGGYTSGDHGGSSRTHAGYALDYLNGFEEGKALS